MYKKILKICLLTGISLLALMTIQAQATAADKTVSLFQKRNIKWIDKKSVKSRKSGVEPCSATKPARLWFDKTPGKISNYTLACSSFDVKGYDFIEIEYRTLKDTFLIIAIRWDGSKKDKRVGSYLTSDGEWKKLKIPITGKVAEFIFNINDKLSANKNGGRAQVEFRPIRLVKAGAVSVKTYKVPEIIIIPEPKQFTALNRTVIMAKAGKAQFGICLNKKYPEVKSIIAKEIAQLCKIDPVAIPSAENFAQLDTLKTVIVLDGGDESKFLSKVKLPVKPESYAIKFIKAADRNIILLQARDKGGLYWAWQTLRQLMYGQVNRVTVTAADIIDWPYFGSRSLLAYNNIQAERAMQLKFNNVKSANWIFKGLFRKPDSAKHRKYIKYIEDLCDYTLPRGGNVVHDLCPFGEPGSFTVSDDAAVESLFKIYDVSLSRGSRIVVLGINDDGRKKRAFTAADKAAYGSDVLLTYAWFMKRLSDKIYAKYPDAMVIGTPHDYETGNSVKGYYQQVGVDKRLRLYWTGAQAITFNFSKPAIKRYETTVEPYKYVLFDNTPTQAHGASRGLAMLEKYATGYKNLLQTKRCVGFEIILFIDNQFRKITAMQAADYMWNAASYDPEKSRQRAIAKVAGSSAAVMPMLNFASTYLKLAYKYPIDKRIRPKKDFIIKTGYRPVTGYKKLDKREMSMFSFDRDEIRQLDRELAELSKLSKKIASLSNNQLLIAELQLLTRNAREIITVLTKNSTAPVKIKPQGTYDFDLNKVPGGIGYRDYGNGKLSVVIYGEQTANRILTASFNMAELPSKSVNLLLEGQSCDKNMVKIKITLNGKTVYSGITPFVQNGWSKKSIAFPAKYFKQGRNTLKIINLANSASSSDYWAMFSGIGFEF